MSNLKHEMGAEQTAIDADRRARIAALASPPFWLRAISGVLSFIGGVAEAGSDRDMTTRQIPEARRILARERMGTDDNAVLAMAQILATNNLATSKRSR